MSSISLTPHTLSSTHRCIRSVHFLSLRGLPVSPGKPAGLFSHVPMAIKLRQLPKAQASSHVTLTMYTKSSLSPFGASRTGVQNISQLRPHSCTCLGIMKVTFILLSCFSLPIHRGIWTPYRSVYSPILQSPDIYKGCGCGVNEPHYTSISWNDLDASSSHHSCCRRTKLAIMARCTQLLHVLPVG